MHISLTEISFKGGKVEDELIEAAISFE